LNNQYQSYRPMDNPYQLPQVAASAGESERAAFIRRTYGHLAGAILAFMAIELLVFRVLFPTEEAQLGLVRNLFGTRFSMLLLLAAFIGGGYLASWWANTSTSMTMQYLGLGLYVVLQAVIFIPLLCIAVNYTDGTVLPTAGILTLGVFGGLTMSVFVTRKDFSFLGPILSIVSFLALGLIIAALIFGFSLGLLFSFAMVALASGYILYSTSNVLHHYGTHQHVAAALSLFAAVALLFFYILRILLAMRRN
jgi:FtsH-binding integral membrane protein